MAKRTKRFKRLIIGIATAVSAAWAGLWVAAWERPLPAGLPPMYYDPFVRQLAEHGRYILPCGGGVICEPARTIDELQGRLSSAELCENCFTLLFGRMGDEEYPEGVTGTAMGVLYRLGDQSTLEKLVDVRGRILRQSAHLDDTVRRNAQLERCERLIAVLCERLHQATPDGVRPLTDEDLRELLE